MNLDDALDHIGEIRQQVARTQLFRGYRSLTVGAVGVLAIAAALTQPLLVPSPTAQLDVYLGLWLSVAVFSVALVGWGLWRRTRRVDSPLSRTATLLAIDQFVPTIGVGALITLGITRSASESAWMLPGLWSLVFSLGVFASGGQLPRAVSFVGLYFAGCGVATLLLGPGAALSAWHMGVSFGGGLLIGAAILYWTLERADVR